jgi:hypothetical protein
MDDMADSIFIELFDDGDTFYWETLVVHQFPDDISVDAVECLLKVDED